MVVQYCDSCGSLLIPSEKKGKSFLECTHCNRQFDHKKISSVEKEPHKEIVKEGAVSDENVFADYEHVCSKCGYGKAEVIDMGVFISDEDNLIFIKCGKCGYSERIGKRTS